MRVPSVSVWLTFGAWGPESPWTGRGLDADRQDQIHYATSPWWPHTLVAADAGRMRGVQSVSCLERKDA